MENSVLTFIYGMFSLAMINLLLSGDNAIVIGLASRGVPEAQQKKVIFWGTFGAIFLRVVLTLVVVWLLKIPGLLAVGGLLLIWIAYQLMVDNEESEVKDNDSFWAAIRTIIIADLVMSMDNVLAIAGAAHGNYILVILGLVISVPIIIWGSTLVLNWINRFPIIIYFGSGFLAWTAAKMIVDEPVIETFFSHNPALKWLLEIVIVFGTLAVGWRKNNVKRNTDQGVQKQA